MINDRCTMLGVEWRSFKDGMPPTIIDILVRGKLSNKWTYAICFRLTDDKDPRKCLCQTIRQDGTIKYLNLDFDPLEWVVLENNGEWDAVSRMKGLL
jgi:hypothetical protein